MPAYRLRGRLLKDLRQTTGERFLLFHNTFNGAPPLLLRNNYLLTRMDVSRLQGSAIPKNRGTSLNPVLLPRSSVLFPLVQSGWKRCRWQRHKATHRESARSQQNRTPVRKAGFRFGRDSGGNTEPATDQPAENRPSRSCCMIWNTRSIAPAMARPMRPWDDLFGTFSEKVPGEISDEGGSQRWQTVP